MLVVTHRCGSYYQGFMEGRHPTVSEGYVERIICFQEAIVPCECYFTAIIGVQNCSGFYVYDLQGVPECNSRFCMIANNSASIKIDPGRPPLYDIPLPGHEPVVVLKAKRDNKEKKSLIVTTTVLSIILLIVLIILIAIILLLLFFIYPMYKRRKQKDTCRENNVALVHVEHSDCKVSGSNGSIPREQSHEDFHLPSEPPDNKVDFVDIPPRPSIAPHIDQPPVFSPDLPPMPSDDEESDKKSPASDKSFPELPEEVKNNNESEDNSEEEYDTLMRREDVKKPQPYKSYDSEV